MTPQERAKVVNIISRTLRENGPVELKFLPRYLSEGGIPQSTYAGPKKWLDTNFPEFFVFGTNGYETVDFSQSNLSRFYKLLITTIPIQAPETRISIPEVVELARKAGLPSDAYASAQAIEELLKVYPAYELEAAAFTVPSASTQEVQYIQTVTYINWKQIYSKISQYSACEIANAEKVRNELAHRFAKAMLSGEGLLLDALNDEPARIVLTTGYETSNGKPICCILQPNVKDSNKQPWMLVGVAYPTEPDAEGFGNWLDQKFFFDAGLSYQTIQTQIDDLLSLRTQLLASIAPFVESLNAGVFPPAIAEEVSRYEHRWQSLSADLKQFPSLPVREEMSLMDLSMLLEEKNEIVDMAKNAILLFEQLYSGTVKRLDVLQATAPAADIETVRSLFASADIYGDIQVFREILLPYGCLQEVLRSDDRTAVQGSISIIAKHFRLDKMDVLEYLLGGYNAKYAFLDCLPEIERILDNCEQNLSAAGEDSVETIDVNVLAEEVLSGNAAVPNKRWISRYNALMPADEQMQDVILAGDGNAELTPGSIAARILAACGNQDHLAEKYLLLGLITDRKACVLQLLGLYRENRDEQRFMKLWNSDYRGVDFSTQDACYWIRLQCQSPSMCWEEIEKFVSENPQLKSSAEYKQIMQEVVLSLERPAAYQRWIGMGDVHLNKLELAIADNDMDEVYLLLENTEQMMALGYDAEEISGIRQVLTTGLPGSPDTYYRAARLYRVQKNKNHSVECILWSAPPAPAVLGLLFDIYSEAEDYSSMCWLTQTFSVPVDTTSRTAAYAYALAKTGQHDILADILMNHPELWHRSELLEGLKDPFWAEIYQRETAAPIRPLTAFDQALIDDDTDGLKTMLADSEQMSQWGYSPEMRQRMEALLAEGNAPRGTDCVSVVKRFKHYQGNLHRGLESYLYQQFETNTNWAVQHLHALAFAEERYVDAVRYFEVYPLLDRVIANINMYLWGLLHLGKDTQLFEQAQLHPECMRTDSELADAIIALAQQKNMQEFSENIQRIITLLPRNAFENAVITANLAEMQKYISNPDLLADLGYSAENITRFKERISKPMPSGSQGYQVAFRMRQFFGNERAIPFLLDSQEDERSAKLLIDIYYSMRQWADVCNLYRANLHKGIWNPVFEKRYMEALSKSHEKEDCELHLKFLESEQNPDKESAAYQWNYLHALIGTESEEAALQQMQTILDQNYECVWDAAMDAFDLTWEIGSQELRKQMALFAARIYLKGMHTMALDQQKAMLSLNGNLLEEDPGDWITLFREQDMEQITTFLMCYFNYGVDSNSEGIEATADTLFKLLEDPNEEKTCGLLIAVTNFALDNNLLAEPTSERSQILLSGWIKLAFSRNQDNGILKLETLTAVEFSAFYEFWKTACLSEAQRDAVCEACFQNMETRTEWTAVFFQRVALVLRKLQSDEEFNLLDLDQLIAAFTRWFTTVQEDDSNSVGIAVQFLTNVNLELQQIKAFLEDCKNCAALYKTSIQNVILSRWGQGSADIQYSYFKGMYLYSEQEDRRQEAISQAESLIQMKKIEMESDNASQQFVYSIVCNNPTPENLHLLYEVYSKVDKMDHASIIAQLENVNSDQTDNEAMHTWFNTILDERSVEWIEYYSKWWAPLVCLKEEDKQTKNIISYLSNDDSSMQHKESVLRLLLSDLHNSAYIGSYLRLEADLSAVASAKLAYIRAVHDATTCVDAIRGCLAKKQYLFAIKLLISEVKPIASNAVFIGQTLGEIFSAESIKVCPELAEFVPNVFRAIISLNQADPVGAWKNIGRAVDIAILTENEPLFFEIFNREYQNMYITYSGKCAALVANLILRKQFETAAGFVQEHNERNGSDHYFYMTLLSSVVNDCLQTGMLSEENEILVRSIPVSGNMRPLELYGSLVNYSIRKKCLNACAKAFYGLSHASQDKALLSSCVQLYTTVMDEYGIAELYAVAKKHFDVAQDNIIVRVGKALAVISACSEGAIDDTQLLSDCQSRIQDGEDLAELVRLKKECIRFCENGNDKKAKKLFLIRAATGWWKLDEVSIKYFAGFGSLCTKLIELYPTSFYAACVSAALRYRSNQTLCNEILALLSIQDYQWGREQVAAAMNYPDALCEQILTQVDSPIELPGLYVSYLSQAFEEPDDNLFIKRISVLLVVQRNFLSTQYEANMCSLKEMSADASSVRQNVLSRLIRTKTARVTGVLQLPKYYADTGEYDMMIVSAEKQLEQNPTGFFKLLNDTYLELGKFMVEQSTTKKYALGQLMNMATLLCQSACYEDVEKLMEICPAKWKLCLRSAQEFVQGNPQNVMYLLNNPDFRTHEGCFAFVYSLAKSYLKANDWREDLKQENLANKRPANWGAYNLSGLLVSAVNTVFLLRTKSRNYVPLASYKEFVDQYIALMNEDDRLGRNVKAGKGKKSKEEDVEEITFQGVESGNSDIWKIPFVAECLDRYQSDDLPDGENHELSGDEKNPNAGRSAQKTELMQFLEGNHSDQETIDACGKLLVLLRQEAVTNVTKRYCIKLGFALYQEKCEHRGLAIYATEEARAILYSMVDLMDAGVSMPGLGGRLKVYIRLCLESYQNLSQFTADCMGDALIKLCEYFSTEDREASSHLQKHILFAREIGQKMRQPMTNTERLEWLQSCIISCRSVEHPVVRRAKETLTNMLNQEIRLFRNKAQVFLQVYNGESVQGYSYIFGKVQNLGGESVSRVVLSLTLNDVFLRQYTMPALNGFEMVPFSLPCGDDEEAESLSYKLQLKYVTQEGTEETIQPVEGKLRLKDPDEIKNHYQYYDASNPADSDNYIERKSINDTLEASYLVDGGFRRFPNFAIYGMKRSGKSSVLRRLGRLFETNYPDSVQYAIVSCEGISGDFFTRAHAVFVKYVMDELDIKFDLQSREGWQEFMQKWEEVPENLTDFRWLDSFYAALRRHWLPDMGLVILVDEIERLYFDLDDDNFLSDDTGAYVPRSVDSSNTQSMLWDVINKISQRAGSAIRFVLCGSDFFTSKIIAEGDNLTQFFQKGVKLNVDRMEYEEIRDALRANPSIELHDDTIDYLWDIANGLPWHSKIFCNSVIEIQLIRKEAGKRTMIYPSDIQNAIDRILSTTKDIASPANFGLLSLDAEEEMIVHTVAEALDTRNAKISLENLMERLHQKTKDESMDELYRKALGSLVNERKLLKMDSDRKYQFGCELYRLHLRHELPPRFL